MLAVYILLPIVINYLLVSAEFIIPKGVHINKPVTMTCKRKDVFAKSVRIAKNNKGIGVVVFSTMMIYHFNVPKNGRLIKAYYSLTLKIDKAACSDAGNYTCMDLSDMDSYPTFTKSMGVYDLPKRLGISNNRFPGSKDCIDRACRMCAPDIEFYYSVGSFINLRCETFLPNLKAIQKSSFHWEGVAKQHYIEDFRNSDIKPSEMDYQYNGCAAHRKIWISMGFKPMHTRTTNINITCSAKFKLEGKTILSISGYHQLCLIGSTIYDKPKIYLSTKGVVKGNTATITCVKQHKRPLFLILYKDQNVLVNMSLLETKIVINRLPHYGYNLKMSTNSFKLTILESSCRDAGSYACKYYRENYYISNKTKVLRVIDKVTKPLITSTGQKHCYTTECQYCGSGTQAYVRVYESLGLSCLWTAPMWDGVTTSYSWIRMEPGKNNMTLPASIPNMKQTNIFPNKSYSTCLPNQMKTSKLRYQPHERHSINVNIICEVNYVVHGYSIMKVYGKLSVCLLAGKKTSSQSSSTTELTTKTTTTTLQTTVTTTRLRTTTTTSTQREPTHQRFLSTTGKPRTILNGGMIAAIVVGVLAVLGLGITMVYLFVDKMIMTKIIKNNENKLSISNRPSGFDFSARSSRMSRSDFSPRMSRSDFSSRMSRSDFSPRMSRSDFSRRSSRLSSRNSMIDYSDYSGIYEY